ncbi:hypothetical protein BSR29_06800 [Boudabousia liubingyangii]|uniref:Carbohydrate kinase PfkB domain-containing protein n=1 Tax=Boudabousia liubingyangii TaxID=1921764 RepID=A0A1Q5PL08_9ACTO|nr:carbohydrate kinase [Boudabousia liubingyangii]OKL47314.1 hypothetical protein BSR29_06800 [Boudabousia liubingyangii]
MNKTQQQDVLVIGEALVDIVKKTGNIAEHPGGSPANVALGLSRLGTPAVLLTWLAHDRYGEMIEAHLKANGVQVQTASFAAHKTSSALATIQENGSAVYDFDVTWELPAATLNGTEALIHVGSFSALMDPGSKRILELLKQAKTRTVISYDPNARPALMGTPAEAQEALRQLLPLVDVVKLSDEDSQWFFNLDPTKADQRLKLAETIFEYGVKLLFITAGKSGAYLLSASGYELGQQAGEVEVVDTVGAGDSFMAAILDGLRRLDCLGEQGKEKIGKLSIPELEKLLNYASRVADVTVSRAGANPPTQDEVAW